MMGPERFVQMCDGVLEILKKHCPVDTGNMRNNGIQLTFFGNGDVAKIRVDMGIAPYMPYTNEPWVSSFWRGKQNPNQYWFDYAFKEILRFAESFSGGKAERVHNIDDIRIEKYAAAYNVRPEDMLKNSLVLSNEYGAFAGEYFKVNGRV